MINEVEADISFITIRMNFFSQPIIDTIGILLDCKCLTGNAGQYPNDPLIGDGYCQDEINNERCNYDGGDCCGPCINERYCTNCLCLKNDTQIKFPNPIIGDGACNSEMNNVKCNYDFGDCCSEFNLVGDGFCNDETNNPR